MMVNISTLGQALDQISRLKTQQSTFETLTVQLTTGKKTQRFAGLENDVLTSQRTRADINSLEHYNNNITNASRRIDQMILSIAEIQKQGENISNALIGSPQGGDYPNFEQIQDLANSAYNFIIDLVNAQDGDRFLFSGADTSTQPISDTGLFEGFLGEFVPDETDLTNPPIVASGVVGQWGDGSITTDQFIQSYRNVNETVLEYSPALTNNNAGNVFVRVDDNSEVDYTVLGNVQGIKDILISLGVLRELPPPEFAPGALNDPTATTLPDDTLPFPPSEKQDNFFQVINDIQQLLNQAIDSLDQEGFNLAQAQAQITLIQDRHIQEINTFESVIAGIEDVDITETATKINALEIQLEASFRITALASEFSLVRFI